jgi:hypothetical protein
MRKPKPTANELALQKEIARKDALIKELAVQLDEICSAVQDFTDDYLPMCKRGNALTKRKAIKDIAFPPRVARRQQTE